MVGFLGWVFGVFMVKLSKVFCVLVVVGGG